MQLSVMIFSKDRAMQLECLLRSFYKHNGRLSADLTVLYRESANFSNSYDDLRSSFPEVKFEKEANFRGQVLGWLARHVFAPVMFLVDDCVFVDEIPISIGSVINWRTIVYPRLGANIDFSLNEQKAIIPPSFTTTSGWLSFEFTKGKAEYSYPWSLDGNVYPGYLIFLLSIIGCSGNPNRFEARLNRFSFLGRALRHICAKKPSITNVSLNVTQTEHEFTIAGTEYTTDQLEQLRAKKYSLHFDAASLSDRQTHQIVEPRIEIDE